ncbi:MAG: heavy-metal-associated domain-containing protein [Bacteroidia bacterium]
MKKYLMLSAMLLVVGFIFAANNPTKNATIEIKTSAQCGHCEETITKALTFTKGVKAVTMNSETKVVTVTYKPNKTSPDQIREAISKVGYDADDLPANAEAYSKLSSCCKKNGKACGDGH